MIISASYKTDIPTFYGEWFMNRIRAGYCKMQNPYNKSVNESKWESRHTQCMVFWTKNIGPMLKHLPELKERGYPFVIQHTMNGYPRELEKRVIDAEQVIESCRTLVDTYGPDVLIWRYDPIVFSSHP